MTYQEFAHWARALFIEHPVKSAILCGLAFIAGGVVM